MGGDIRWEDTLSAHLERILTESRDLSQDAREGAEVVMRDAQERVPKRSGHLVGTGMVQEWRGGKSTAAMTFGGPYARWVHEHLWFKHPFGGQAKYLETAMFTKGGDAVNDAGRHFWRRIT